MTTLIRSCLLTVAVMMAHLAAAQDSTVVYFPFDRHDLSPAAKQALDSLAAKPHLFQVKIFGHTDQLGSEEYNLRLSLRRATAVKTYLGQQGVDTSKIVLLQGLGKQQPVNPALSAAARQSNRRVLIIASHEHFAKDSVVIEQSHTKQQPLTPPVSENRSPRTSLIEEITDTSVRAGDNIILKNINFFGGRAVFLPQSYTALTELLHAMQSIPSLEIEIQGHICCQPGPGDGMDIDTGEPYLSYNRARAVWEYLVERGIDRKRMTYKGFGHRFPLVAVETNEAERTMNRRVEIKIIRK